jgi:TolB protein
MESRRLCAHDARMMFRSITLVAFTVAILVGEDRAPKTIAFGSFAPVRLTVFIADANGDGTKPLLREPGMDYNASFSRDGVWVVFTSERGGSADIWRVHPDGSGLERLTDHRAFDDQAALSPDGRTLAFVSTRGGPANIWLLDLATHSITSLTKSSSGDFRPAWSPDGQWIAFSSDRDNVRATVGFGTIPATSVSIIRRDGSGLRRLTSTTVSAGSPVWSSDGSHVIYYQTAVAAMGLAPLSTKRLGAALPPNAPRAQMQIVATDIRDGSTETLAAGPGLKLSPRWLASGDIAYISPDGLELVKGSHGARGDFGSPDWSPDASKIVFHRETDAIWPPFQKNSRLDNSFHLIRTGIFPSYSPSGDRLVCNTGLSGIAHNGILLMNADGSNRQVLFDDPARSAVAPVWSPRGDRLAFAVGQFFPMVAGREQFTSNLALIRTDGGGFEMLTRAIAPDSQVGRRTGSGWSIGQRTGKNAGCESSNWQPIESQT